MDDAYDITRDKVTGLNFLFPAITDDSSPHSNTGLELSHDVTRLPVVPDVRHSSIALSMTNSLLLVPTDQSVQEQDTDLSKVWSTGSRVSSLMHSQ